jgi:alpha-mannosidase
MKRRHFLACLGMGAAIGRSEPSGNTLYMLTYDHGGLILWGTDHFRKYLCTAAEWMDRYPSFKIGIENEAYAYDCMAEQDPKLLEELRGMLTRYRGRFGIGTCTYGQPLMNFLNEESNIRQIGYGLETDRKRLGTAPEIYLMSEHAMHSQIPQILAGFGFKGAIMRTHFMMYGYDPQFDVAIGWWVGLDGSRIAAIPTYKGEGAGFGQITEDNRFLTRYPTVSKASPEDFRQKFARIKPLLATRADDSNWRQEGLVKEYEGKPGYRWILLDEILPNFPSPTQDMKTAPNDFHVRMPWGYCGNEIWNQSRLAEVGVLTAERLAALVHLLGGSGNREEELRQSWKSLLVAQHHDIQITGIVKDARKFLGASIEISGRVTDDSMRYVASHMKGTGAAQVTVFNPCSWPRKEWVEGILAEVPALGFASYSPAAAKASAGIQIDDAAMAVTTPYWKIRFHPEGGLLSLEDRRTGKSFLKPGRRSGFFAGRIEGADCESKGKWTLTPGPQGNPWMTAHEEGSIGNIPYALELAVPADSRRLDFIMKFHISGQRIGTLSENKKDGRSPFVHDTKLRFKLFPAAGEGATGVRDVPFGASETSDPNVEGIYWTALSDARTGIAIFNRGTMGSVREPDGGFSIPLAYAMNYIWGTRMLGGDFSYEFALYPFEGEWSRADLHRKALEYNFPLIAVKTAPGDGRFGREVTLLEAASPDAIVTALYTAEGKTYGRLFACQGRAAQVDVRYLKGRARMVEVDLAGNEKQAVTSPLSLRPWQFRTVRVEPLQLESC